MERFESLPEVFTFDEFSKFYTTEISARNMISRLLKNNVIQKVKMNVWKKMTKTLDTVLQQS